MLIALSIVVYALVFVLIPIHVCCEAEKDSHWAVKAVAAWGDILLWGVAALLVSTVVVGLLYPIFSILAR